MTDRRLGALRRVLMPPRYEAKWFSSKMIVDCWADYCLLILYSAYLREQCYLEINFISSIHWRYRHLWYLASARIIFFSVITICFAYQARLIIPSLSPLRSAACYWLLKWWRLPSRHDKMLLPACLLGQYHRFGNDHIVMACFVIMPANNRHCFSPIQIFSHQHSLVAYLAEIIEAYFHQQSLLSSAIAVLTSSARMLDDYFFIFAARDGIHFSASTMLTVLSASRRLMFRYNWRVGGVNYFQGLVGSRNTWFRFLLSSSSLHSRAV